MVLAADDGADATGAAITVSARGSEVIVLGGCTAHSGISASENDTSQ